MTNRPRIDPLSRLCARGPVVGRAVLLAAGAGCWIFIAGCAITLEDGYKPKPLDASAEVRRSYYASPFTDQADPSAAANQPSAPRGGR